MAKMIRLTNVVSQHKELWWLLSGIAICVAGLFGIVTTAFIWYL